MKILFLGEAFNPLVDWLRREGEEVMPTIEPLSHLPFEVIASIDLIISYGYRYKVGSEILKAFPHRAINCHISYLPWNRGADPNFWSWVEDTPKGVTIHEMDEGIDTGPILARMRKLDFTATMTLRETDDILQRLLQGWFKEAWPEIRRGKRQTFPQHGGGSYHRLKDKDDLWAKLCPLGRDTPVSKLQAYGEELRKHA